jgi:hypothetical protein
MIYRHQQGRGARHRPGARQAVLDDAHRLRIAARESYGDERWIEVSPPEGGPLLVLSPRAADEPRREVPDELPHSPVFFNCADIEATHRELSQRGVEFSTPPTQQHFGWWALFEDPDGTRYALGQWD